MQSAKVVHCGTRSPPVVNFSPLRPLKVLSFRSPVFVPRGRSKIFAFNGADQKKRLNVPVSAINTRRLGTRRELIPFTPAATRGGGSSVSEFDENIRKLLQAILWIAEGVYIIWLFVLPYAPGDPVWAISSETINSLMSEGLFNFVIGWTFMFAPLLHTDKLRDRYKGSLDVLWGFQMFLTNTFLIPYMAIRLNEAADDYTPKKTSQLGLVMTRGAAIVGLIGGLACLLSLLWALYGRGDGNYGNLPERWEFLLTYLGSERLAYAFIWDICLYVIFQPWLIRDNLQNIQKDKVAVVNILRFIPVVGLVAYCLCLTADTET